MEGTRIGGTATIRYNDTDMSRPNEELPAYHVRASHRARRVSLRMSMDRGLEVVVPAGFDKAEIPALLRSRRAWIDRQQERLAALRARYAHCHPPLPADRIRLAALDRDHPILRRNRGGRPCLEAEGSQLILLDTHAEPHLETPLLRTWLKRLGRQELPPRLRRLADAHDFDYQRVSIRLQRTRWGSCSSSGTISLNAALLFLSPSLLRHVLIHELCHTRQMDHSPRFWSHVARLEPEYARRRGELKHAWMCVPAWAGRQR